MYGKGPFGKEIDVAAEVTGGVCPTCTHETMFISLTPELYRCVSCGSDCRQYINGSIRYLPAITKLPEENINGKSPKVGG
jgi:uncharacterized protein (DUF983 family)